jgi:hypothetical protein
MDFDETLHKSIIDRVSHSNHDTPHYVLRSLLSLTDTADELCREVIDTGGDDVRWRVLAVCGDAIAYVDGLSKDTRADGWGAGLDPEPTELTAGLVPITAVDRLQLVQTRNRSGQNELGKWDTVHELILSGPNKPLPIPGQEAYDYETRDAATRVVRLISDRIRNRSSAS